MNIEVIIKSLSSKRSMFVSEADFQFALAWEIKTLIPNAEVRMEYCPVDIDESMHIDIAVRVDDRFYPIELKYLTKRCTAVVKGERYMLKNQGAQDIRRYDFLKDVLRLEKVAFSDKHFERGYAILLTNDSTYWNESSKKDTCDSEFRIHEGAIKKGELMWAIGTGKGTIKGREQSIILKNTYNMRWKDYNKINEKQSDYFRYLCTEILKVNDVDSFWVYENWVADKKAVIHRGTCSHCNNGIGTHKNTCCDSNGRWHGEFNSYELAKEFALNLNDRVMRDCGHCKPNIK